MEDIPLQDRNKKYSLKGKWNDFFKVVFDPWVILLLVLTIIFIIYSANSADKSILGILTLVITLLSGLLGGVITNRWAQMTELKVLVARGKSAIRSLKLILLNISNIEKRTKVYIECLDKENKEFKLIVSNFQEVIEKCNILEEEIISSIENWTDIIPEVENLKTQIGVISSMKIRETELQGDIENLNSKIVEIAEVESKEKMQLKSKLYDKEKDLNKTKEELREAERKLNTTVLSGLTASGAYSVGARFGISNFGTTVDSCGRCGKSYSPNGIFADNLCDDCRANPRSFVMTRKK